LRISSENSPMPAKGTRKLTNKQKVENWEDANPPKEMKASYLYQCRWGHNTVLRKQVQSLSCKHQLFTIGECMEHAKLISKTTRYY
jgi:hypothetical protein